MKQYLGIDLGGTAIKYALMDENGSVFSPASIPTPKTSFAEFLEVLDSLVLPVKDQISGIAMSMPGRVDNITGYIYTGGAISSYMTNVPLGKILKEHYQLPVAIENDGKCAAHAELWKGNLKDVNSGAVIIIGYGIGGGIVLNHQIWRGFHGSAGEFSYLMMDYYFEDQPLFWSFHNGVNSLLKPFAEKKGLNFSSVNGKVFFEALHQKDSDATEIFNRYIKSFCSGILTLQSILDVEKYCIGGGISVQDILIDHIRNAVNDYFDTAPDYVATIRPEIDRCQFKNDANLIGALKNFMDNNG